MAIGQGPNVFGSSSRSRRSSSAGHNVFDPYNKNKRSSTSKFPPLPSPPGGTSGSGGRGSGRSSQYPPSQSSQSSGKTASGDGGKPPKAPPLKLDVEKNPDIQRALQDTIQYRQQLGAGTDIDAINAMQRARDLSSGILREFEGSGRASQLGGPGGGAYDLQRGDILREGLLSAQDVNAQNVAGARQLQLQALGQQGQLGIGSAADIRSGERNLLAGYQAQNDYTIRMAQLDALKYQNEWDNYYKGLGLFLDFYGDILGS
jgi:hypothetical protein